MPQVVVPAPYRGPTQGQGRIEVSGATVRECLLAVEGRYPGFAEQVFDGAGSAIQGVPAATASSASLP